MCAAGIYTVAKKIINVPVRPLLQSTTVCIMSRMRTGSKKISAVDLFCGVGGLTHGLVSAGVTVAAGYDIDATCKYPYEANNGGATFHEVDVTKLSPDTVAAHFPEDAYKVLVGCAPCQPYSSITNKVRKGKDAKALEENWGPLRAFLRLIREIRPDVVSMENVTRLANRAKNPIYGEFVDGLGAAGYEVSEANIYCPEYGVPQRRRRLVLMASRHGPIALPPPTHTKETFGTVEKALAGLPAVAAGEAHPDDPLHVSRNLTALNLARVKASKPGGTWEDWPSELRLACHSRDTGKTFKSVYGRMLSSEPSPTITTEFYNLGTGRFVHPTEDRGLSLREGALLQTFPRDYRFVEDGKRVSMTALGRHIGNAVPVGLGEAIGRAIVEHLACRATS